MTSVEIRSMHLRIPAATPVEAEAIAQQVSRQFAQQAAALPAGGRLDGLQIRLQAPAGYTPESLSEAIVQAILDQIGR